MARKSSIDTQSIDTFSSNHTRSEQSNTRSEAQKERVSTACTYCRYRKVKCDGGKPFCSFCVHMGRSECIYAKVSEEENQHLRRRKRELRARRAAERLEAEKEQNLASPQSPSSSMFILNDLLSSSSPTSSSSNTATVSKRRRSSVPKRSRKRSMVDGTISSQSTPNIFSGSTPSQMNPDYPPEMTLSGLPTELTNTFSSDFLNLLTPQSTSTSTGNIGSSIGIEAQLDGSIPYVFTPNSIAINNTNHPFDVNAPTFDWTFEGIPSSAPAQSSSSSMLMDQKQESEQRGSDPFQQSEDQLNAQMVPSRSIFALAASTNSFTDSMTGTFDMTIPSFKGPSIRKLNLRPSNEEKSFENVQEENMTADCSRKNSIAFSTSSQIQTQNEQGDPLLRDMTIQLQDFTTTSTFVEQAALQQQSNQPDPMENFTIKRRFSNISEEVQSIYNLWPTSLFHPNQGKQQRASIPHPNEPESMPELKRFLCTPNNPFSSNPVMPLAMSVPLSERNQYVFPNFPSSSSSSTTSS